MMSTSDNAAIIWRFLKEKGLNNYAVAGIMGNLQAESALNPKNLQRSYERKLGMTDNTYTASVDLGGYSNFVRDGAGYGLVQWTYWSRKQGLLDYAKEHKKSIGDLQMQLDYMWQELKGYKSVMTKLNAATSILDASNAVLKGYEKPTNQGASAQAKRASYGQQFFDRFAVSEDKPSKVEPEQNEKHYRTHKVKRGDTLWGLAQKYLGAGVKWRSIAELNGISGTLIRDGQILKIPGT